MDILSKFRTFRELRRQKKGAAAVEFALIAGPFLFVIFAIIELTIVFLMDTAVNNAAFESARLVRTGQLQGSTDPKEMRKAVCKHIDTWGSCKNLAVSVSSFNRFSSSNIQDFVLDRKGSLDQSKMTYDPGDAGDIIVVRIFYDWRIMTPVIGQYLSNKGGNSIILASTFTYRNEPFDM